MKLKTRFSFDSAHRLVDYIGPCSNLHGHRWEVDVDVIGEGLDKAGMLWDFTNVRTLKQKYDHKTLLKRCEKNRELGECLERLCGGDSVLWLDDNPTAECLGKTILKDLLEKSPDYKFKIKVYESPTSYAEVHNESQ